MEAQRPIELDDEARDTGPRYVSFILRCHVNTEGSVRVRLLDVRSGVSCPVGDLDELPGIVRRLMSDVPADGDT